MKIVDVHFHIIDYKYLVAENNGYLQPEFLTDDYEQNFPLNDYFKKFIEV